MATTKNDAGPAKDPAALIDARIKELGDWRGDMLSRIRTLVKQAEPDVNVTFFKGASQDDAAGLFNSSLEGNARRAIDLGANDTLDENAFTALVRAAADLNSH